MQKVGEAFYGRARVYESALAGDDPAALETAVARNVFGTLEPGLGARRLAAYMKDTVMRLERQRADGSWDESMGEGKTREAIITGTGFPRVFYLAYHTYRDVFPLLALTNYRRAMSAPAD